MKNTSSSRKYMSGIFGKVFLYYIVISLLTIVLFTVVWYRSSAKSQLNQSISYNKQQLEALSRELRQQELALKQSQMRLYTHQMQDGKSPYRLFSEFMHGAEQGTSEILNQQQIKRGLHNYLSASDRPRENDMNLHMLTGLTFHTENIYTASTGGQFEPEDFAREILRRIESHPAKPSRKSVYTVPTFTLTNQEKSMRVYILYDYLRDDDNPSLETGYIINAYNPERFDLVLKGFLNPFEGRAYILDNKGQIIYDSLGESYGEKYTSFHEILPQKTRDYATATQHLSVLYDNSFDYYVIGELSRTLTSSFLIKNYGQIFIVALIAFLMTALLSALSLRSTAQRFQTLLYSMTLAQQDLTVRAPLSERSDELDALSQGLNSLLHRIECQIQDSYVKELKEQQALVRQREAELYALQSQINPHFLYNTLEIIRMKALEHEDEDIAMMIKSLATVFRERSKGSGIVLLRQELSVCQQLLEIYSIRFDTGLALRLEIPHHLLRQPILFDILTPLVENAVVHGLEKQNLELFQVTMSARENDTDIWLTVSDNGSGMSPQDLDKIRTILVQPILQSRSHIGLQNIHGRLRLVYGKQYGMHVESQLGVGTLITLHMKKTTLEELGQLVSKKLLEDSIGL